ncbi:MAG: T9SS type A sorting domain-containing protein [Bacteroidales bacterium]|nr:T9SS type A sorting domain-containing protein [Bacteroidales bacterium]
MIRLEFGEARSAGTLEISNMIGESILKREFSGHSPYELDLSSLPNGMYIIHVQFDGVYGVQRFVKQ